MEKTKCVYCGAELEIKDMVAETVEDEVVLFCYKCAFQFGTCAMCNHNLPCGFFMTQTQCRSLQWLLVKFIKALLLLLSKSEFLTQNASRSFVLKESALVIMAMMSILSVADLVVMQLAQIMMK